MAGSADQPEWVIVLVPVDGDERPVGRRVARLLKYALRAAGLRAVTVRYPTEEELAAVAKILGRDEG